MENYNQQIKDHVICQAWSVRPSSMHDFTTCSLCARTLTLQAEGYLSLTIYVAVVTMRE